MGSDGYVRTYRDVVRRLLQLVSEKITSVNSYRLFDEAEAIEVLQESASKKRPESKGVIELEAQDAKTRSSACLADLGPAAQDERKVEAVPGKLDLQVPEPDSEVEAEATYIISEDQNRGRSCLHAFGGCYRAKRRSFKSFELVYTPLPPQGMYDVVCRVCWPEGLVIPDVADEGNEDLVVSDSGASDSE